MLNALAAPGLSAASWSILPWSVLTMEAVTPNFRLLIVLATSSIVSVGSTGTSEFRASPPVPTVSDNVLPDAIWSPSLSWMRWISVLARFDTVNVVELAEAPVVAVAVTAVDDDDALTACQVGLTGLRPVEVKACAADFSAVILLFTDWYAEMTVFCWVTWVFRLVCGCASTCMSCEMIVDVLRPLTRPSTVLRLLTGVLLSPIMR